MKKWFVILLAALLVALSATGCAKKAAPQLTSENAKVGETVSFGQYEWIVLAKEGSKVLLLTKEAIASKGYNKIENQEPATAAPTESEAEPDTIEESVDPDAEDETEETEPALPVNTRHTPTSWEECTLRAWLNGEFLNKFTEAEQAKILTTEVKTEANRAFGTSGGNDTNDQVFLLSLEEIEEYLPTEADRVCYPNDDAKNAGVYEMGGVSYWLRTPGNDATYVVIVGNSGGISVSGFLADGSATDAPGIGVRPAIWVEIGD